MFFSQRDFEFVWEVDGTMNHHSLLGRVFAAWNCGSGQECDMFLRSQVRSLSVGDFVAIDGSWYKCEPMGWTLTTQDIKSGETLAKLLPPRNLDALVLFVKKHAEEHYEDGGWDVIAECWGDEDIRELLNEKKATTEREAIASFECIVSVWAERQADAAFHRREAIGDEKQRAEWLD